MCYLSSKNYVYWLFDHTCGDPQLDGYVGITKSLKRRIKEHAGSGRFPSFFVQILYAGTREECLFVEANLRFHWNMGWNKSPGGRSCSANGVFKGKKFTEEHRRKISESHKGRRVNEKTRMAVAEANRNRVWTTEQRAKRAELTRKRNLDRGSGWKKKMSIKK